MDVDASLHHSQHSIVSGSIIDIGTAYDEHRVTEETRIITQSVCVEYERKTQGYESDQ